MAATLHGKMTTTDWFAFYYCAGLVAVCVIANVRDKRKRDRSRERDRKFTGNMKGIDE